MELKGPEIAYGEAVRRRSPDSGNVVGWNMDVGGLSRLLQLKCKVWRNCRWGGNRVWRSMSGSVAVYPGSSGSGYAIGCLFDRLYTFRACPLRRFACTVHCGCGLVVQLVVLPSCAALRCGVGMQALC